MEYTPSEPVLPADIDRLLQDKGKSYDLGVAARFISTSKGDEAAVSFLNWVFPYAASIKASDIHFRDQKNGCQVRLRNRKMQMEDSWLFSRMAAQTIDEKIRAKCNISSSDRESPQDGSFWLLDQERDSMVDVRVSILPTRYGQSMVCRILNQENAGFGLDAVYMPDYVRHALEQALANDEGMILVCGPTGSGKSFTLNACLNHINRKGIHLCTAEDPVEYPVEGANQVSIHPVHRPFARVLRSFLRHDPDVILVGEIRDLETAQTAVTAANTGHLILSTLHANNAALALSRLVGLGVEAYLLADVMLAFFSQRLMNRLCLHCRTEVVPDAGQALPTRFPAEKYFRRNSAGCDECNHEGSISRIPVMEFALNAPDVRLALINGDSQAMEAALLRQPSYRTLSEAALEMSAAGLVDFDEACHIGSLAIDRLSTKGGE
jgi:predicted GSPII_E, type II/IV secretion system protein